MAKLARLKPGANTTLEALQRQDGAIAAQPAEMIEEQSRHRADIFRCKPHDAGKTTEWFQRAYPDAGSLSELSKLP